MVLITDNEQRTKTIATPLFLSGVQRNVSFRPQGRLITHCGNCAKKSPETHRYMLTENLHDIIISLMAARCATAEMLMKAA